MRKILLFGAGKSATFLIGYLLQNALKENWTVTVVDADISQVQSKIGNASRSIAACFDIKLVKERQAYIEQADIVISLLPPSLHYLVAQDCVQFKKNLLTASYIDEHIKSIEPEILKNDLLFLCEMGLDPGIDHMSAKKMIDDIHGENGSIQSFISHCGGLVAPESDDNPWHYKISWNPKNVVQAGKSGAIYKKDNEIKKLDYEKLFSENHFINIPGYDVLSWYPNRDSLSYISTYELEDCPSFIRTTLRHPDFMYGWQNVVDLQLTDENYLYQTDGKSLKDFFKEHLERHGFANWLEEKMHSQFEASKKILEDLLSLAELEEKAEESEQAPVDDFMMVNETGDLQKVVIDNLKTTAANTVAYRMHEAKLTLKQLFFLGMDDEETIINKGQCTAADVLQLILEKKLPLLAGEQDMVIMLHEIEYEKQGKKFKNTSHLVIIGEDDHHTAMAKTVGLPLGIAAKLILNGVITTKGLQIPVLKEIYEPVLRELALHDISFTEKNESI